MSDLRLLWRSIRAEILIFRRTPIAAFFTLGLPLLMLVLFVALFGNDTLGSLQYGPVSTAQFYVAGLGVFAAASATYTNIAVNLSFRRDQGILKRIRGTPIPPWLFLGGVILAALAIAVFATSVMVALGVAAYGVGFEAAKVPAVILSFLAGVLCFATLGIALSALASTGNSAVAIANATILPMAFTSNVFIPLQDPPVWLNLIGDLFPLKPFAVAFSEAMSPFSEAPAIAWDRLGALAAWTAIGALVAWRRFRWEPAPGVTGRRSRRRAAPSAQV